MQTQKHVGKRSLARATAAHKRDRLAGQNFESDVLQRVSVRTCRIAKRHVVKLDVAANARHVDQRLFGRVLFGFGVEHVVKSFECDVDLLKLSPQINDAQDWSRDTADQDVEGDELADRKFTVDDQMRAVPEEKQRIERLQHIADGDGSPCR